MTDNASAEGCADDSQRNSRELCRRQSMQQQGALQKTGGAICEGNTEDSQRQIRPAMQKTDNASGEGTRGLRR